MKLLFGLASLATASAAGDQRPVISLDLAQRVEKAPNGKFQVQANYQHVSDGVWSKDREGKYHGNKFHAGRPRANIICHKREEWLTLLSGGKTGFDYNKDVCSEKFCCTEAVDPKNYHELKAAHHIYAKECRVLKDNAKSCAIPKASAFDHHDQDLTTEVVRTEWLSVQSLPSTLPKAFCDPSIKYAVGHHCNDKANQRVNLQSKNNKTPKACSARSKTCGIDWNMRGEFMMNFDVVDNSGNKAEPIEFAMIMRDHVAPYCRNTLSDAFKQTTYSVEAMDGDMWEQYYHLPNTHVEAMHKDYNVHIKKAMEHSGLSYCKKGHLCVKDEYDGIISGDRIRYHLTYPDGTPYKAGETDLPASDDHIEIDTSVLGVHKVEIKAHDWANIFGLNNKDNIGSCAQTIVVVDTTKPHLFCKRQKTDVPVCTLQSVESGNSVHEHGRLVLPTLVCTDTIPCNDGIQHECEQEYEEPGAICVDSHDSFVSNLDDLNELAIIPTVSIGTPKQVGDHLITYKCTDGAGNSLSKTRKVTVDDKTPPKLDITDSTALNYVMTFNCGKNSVNKKLWSKAIRLNHGYTASEPCEDETPECSLELYEDNCHGAFKCKDHTGKHYVDCEGEGKLVTDASGKACEVGGKTDSCFAAFDDEEYFTAAPGQGGKDLVTFGLKYTCKNSNDLSISKCRTIELQNTDLCNPQPVHCAVNAWSGWDSCSKSCGQGSQQRNRKVTVMPQYEGETCPHLNEWQNCNNQACPVDCEVHAWSAWSKCPVTCDGGIATRTRRLTEPKWGGKACRPHKEQMACNTVPCAVDCVSQWLPWSACTKSCTNPATPTEHGMQFRHPRITVAGRHGGLKCPEAETRDCNKHPCPADCEVGSWSTWTGCTNSCGSGLQKRTRSHTAPKEGGKACPGTFQEQKCNVHPCPIDCEVGTWKSWGACSGSCTLSAEAVKANYCDANKEHPSFAVGGYKYWKDAADKLIPTQIRNRPLASPLYGGKACPASQVRQHCNRHNCPQDCLYGENNKMVGATGCLSHSTDFGWSEWSPCSQSCETGTQYRSRTTKDPLFGGKVCLEDRQYQSCNHHKCPVDCEVGTWGGFDECTHSCGGGSQTRTRSFTAPVYGGKACPSKYGIVVCNSQACPVDCERASWNAWQSCSKSCGKGLQIRNRGIAVQPQNGGAVCATGRDNRACNGQPCPVDCVVGKWSSYGKCTLSCGGGSKIRTRKLTPPQLGGKLCPSMTSSADCNTLACPVDCVLGPAYWTKCDKECTDASLVKGSRNHQQNIVQAKFGGKACPTTTGSIHILATGECNTHRCAVDCTTTPWNAWSTCTLSCGADENGESGSQTRTRTIVSKAAHGGVCPDLKTKRSCNFFPCPVDCEVYNWSPYSPCTKSCGVGSQKRSREIVKPLNGGKACPDTTMTQKCNGQSCPVDCIENSFGAYGKCDKSCGTGLKTRTRTFTQPTFGGKICGPREDTMNCNTHECPVDCVEVQGWSSWSTCTKSCNGGTKSRSRKMNQITKFGGACASEFESGVLCNTEACPVDCVYSYGAWSTCTKSCGKEGTQVRSRITTVWPNHGGKDCGALKESQNCNVKECPVDCVPTYGNWGACSTSCGPGRKSRSRTVVGPFHGGRECPREMTNALCNVAACPADCEVGAWGAYGTCSKKCNTGASDIELAERTRKITKPAAFGGKACASLTSSRVCNPDSCPIDCEVGEWGVYGACDATCGSGSQTRYRSSTQPQFGGRACPASFSLRPCNTYSCGKTVLVVVTVTSTMDGISKHDFTCEPRNDDGSRNTACPEDSNLEAAFATADKSMQQGFIDSMLTTLGASDTVGGSDVRVTVISCTCSSTVAACVAQTKPAHCNARRLLESAEKTFLVVATDISTADPAMGKTMEATASAPTFAKDLVKTAESSSASPLAAIGEHAYTFEAAATAIVVDDCTISKWSTWSSCTKTCGGGLRSRTREVTQIATEKSGVKGVACPSDEYTFKNVLGDRQTMSEVCEPGVCPVECKVGAWSAWGACSLTCGTGSQTRFRKVTRSGHASVCPTLSENQACSTDACPVDCVYTTGRWTACATTCGVGNKKTRTHTAVSGPKNGGKACPRSVESSTEGCSTTPCPVDCIEAAWGTWSPCSKKCGGGAQSRTRSYIKPQWGGKKCGADVSFQNCNEHKCPIDCKVKYGMWGTCTKTCGTGSQSRSKTIGVMSAHGGKACRREATLRSCNAHLCPADCKVGPWSEKWTSCTKSCGTGTKTRTRALTRPSAGGKPCPTATQVDNCNAHGCPVDCALAAWDFALISSAPCSAKCGHGLKTRTRGIKTAAAFGGKACSKADMTETAHCDTTSMCPRDCHMSRWSKWSVCTASCLTGSQTRTRTIVKTAIRGGAACKHTHEYASCNEQLCPVDCVVGTWGPFHGHCSAACGGGKESRVRSVTAPKYDGKACPTSIEYKDCNTHSCPIDCEVGDWSTWGHCSRSCGAGNHIRTRTLHPAKHGGKACPGSAMETKSCNTQACPEDCVVASWSTWSACDKVCAGGIRSRTRGVTSPISGGKLCPHTYEEDSCNSQPCPIDCQLGSWTPGACSMTCHLGTRMWSAKFVVEDKFGGKTCKQVVSDAGGAGNPHMLVETNPSEGAVKGPLQCVDSETCPVHCEVSTWSAWSGCGRSCGGGSKTRTRTIETKVEGRGSACPDLTNVVACDTNNCPTDCTVSKWSSWSPCSASCGNANHQHRTRTVVADKHPVYGGKPCPILLEEQMCNNHKCPVDGHYAAGWSAWSTCSVTCGTGSQDRLRVCTKPLHGGKPCPMPNMEKRPCSLVNCPRDCELSDFSDWSTCTASCGKGTQKRARTLTFAPSFGGAACKHLSEDRDCNAHSCPINCNVGGWQSYSNCDRSCGTGSQVRSRFLTQPKYGGVVCPKATATRSCNVHACPVDCTVEAWAAWTSCTTTCGTGIQTRTRVTLAPVAGGKGCPHDIHYRSCNTHKCPTDCTVGAWSAWASCSASCGTGSQSRSRTLTQPLNGGKACDAPAQKRSCNTNACPVDCSVGKWSAWTTCTKTCGNGKQSRKRNIAQPVFGGAVCPTPTESRTCNSVGCPQDCVVSTWTAWKSCTKSCNGGSQIRRRQTLPPSAGGKLCPNSAESRSCNTHSCPVDCNEVSAWTAWTTCSVSCGIGMHGRERVQEEPKYGGVACGDYKQERKCTDGPCPVHCEIGSWKSWGSCSKSCATCMVYKAGSKKCVSFAGKGYQSRKRPIVTSHKDSTLLDGTVLKGQVCPATLEGRDCNVHECPVDCAVGSWNTWSKCTKSCGVGTQRRSRSNVAPRNAGKNCPATQVQRNCNKQDCPTNCVVSTWQRWGACSTTCGGGAQKRVRTLVRPGFGGSVCPTGIDRRRCNEHACPIDCNEGRWGTHFDKKGVWMNSPVCSKSCGSGSYVVTRDVKQPSYGGAACGPTRKVVTCNHGPCPVHCEVGAWSSWKACTASCGIGSQKRMRKITIDFKDGHTCSLSDPGCKSSKKVQKGTRCPDVLHTQLCNQQKCAVDCEVAAWSSWSTCAQSCQTTRSTGTQTRARTTTEPKFGGKACPVSFQEIKCNQFMCPVDCAVGTWNRWNSCSLSCGSGTQQRSRQLTEPRYGGKRCPTARDRKTYTATRGGSAETSERSCNRHECPIDCVVSNWGRYGKCSRSCTDQFGIGNKIRTRKVTVPVQHGGVACPTLTMTSTCNDYIKCPIDCQGKWDAWGSCSASCTDSVTTGAPVFPTQRRWHRVVLASKHGGKACNGWGVRECNTHFCPVDFKVTAWSRFTSCSKSCGGGIKTRKRKCTQPLFGGAACPKLSEVKACNTEVCPTPAPTPAPTLSPTNVPYPVINVIGGDEITVEATTDLSQSYDDEGATCFDTHDGDITKGVVVMGDIVNLIDAFSACRHIQYECTNAAGLTSSKVRTVCVEDTTCPTCRMAHAKVQTITVEASFPYVDGGATCSDVFDGTKAVDTHYSYGKRVVKGINVEQTGTYVITYSATDESNNSCRKNENKNPRRTVVVADTLKPVIGLEYGGKLIHRATSEQKSNHVTDHRRGGVKQQNTATFGNGRKTLNPADNYFFMAESSATSPFVLGAIASAIAGIALFSYATQQKTTSAVADLV